jgi:Ca2+:H+ antiporter
MLMRLLLLLVPIALVLHYAMHAPAMWVFITAVLAIIPLAEMIRKGTEQVANIAGPAIGGLLNVTFGNMAELILAIFVLLAGRQDVVKAQITGSLIGNSLLGLGLGIVAGSFGRASQKFKKERAGMLSSMLILVVIALLLPAIFDYTERGVHATNVADLDDKLSLGVSVVLIAVYILNLLYTLWTHKDVFAISHHEDTDESGPQWSLAKGLGVMIGATVVTAVMAELVSGALEETSAKLGLSEFFLGIIVLAVVGNAAEYFSAVYFARKNRMELVASITVGATIQVALLVAPLLVIISHLIGKPMNLVFSSPLELIAIAAAAFAVNSIVQDGETTWFEGVLLLAVYVILGIAFLYVTPPLHAVAR